MVFSSLTCLYLFLPICILLYFLRPSVSYKNWVLVIFSVFFYAWGEPVYVILLLFSAWMNYLFGRWIGDTENRSRAKLLLAASVVLNLGLLGYFKYAGHI